MENSRRKFLKFAGVSALGLSSLSALNVFNTETAEAAAGSASENLYTVHDEALTAGRWGMVVDTRKINARIAKKLVEACHQTHNVPDFTDPGLPGYTPANARHIIKWIWSDTYDHVFPDKADDFLADRLKSLPIPALCNHCDNPPCVRVCPTKATFKRRDGVVMMDFHRCIGCRFCMAGCPYGARSFNYRDPRPAIKNENEEYPTRMKGVVEKCNFCEERLAVGKQPACVEASDGALVFGDLSDPNSEVRQLLKSNYAIRRKQGLGTNPSVYYIV
jgi:Fe-S-cluster-containing dehydrogenase component